MSRLSEKVTARVIASSTPIRVRPWPGQCPRREGRSYTCLSNGKLERNIGECAGSGVFSHTPAERLGVELEFEQPSRVIERLRTGVQISYMSAICGPSARAPGSHEARRVIHS